jgi:uncharacterized membrane protein
VETRRAESFSDGVFAVAITVLVFNLLPIADKSIGSYHDLARFWPQYSAYVVSFLTIGIMWLNHHTLVAQLARVDRITLVINTFLLMGVVAVPFPTALIAESLSAHPNVSPKVATVAYGLLLIAISFAYSGMWMYVAANQARLGNRRIRTPLEATIRFSAGLLGYVAGTVAALFGAGAAAIVIYAAVAVYYLFDHLPDPSEGDPGQPGAAADAAAGSDAGPG